MSVTNQISIQSRDAIAHRRINLRMVQNVLLIWLDSNINENSADCQNTLAQLRHAVNTINTYTDGEECIQFLETIDNDNACMVISGSLGQQIVPRVHDMPQVDSIFIFCGNKKYHEQWSKKWPKIKGVFTEISPICEALKQAARECEQNAISISFMATDGDSSNKKLDQLDPSFMYTQIFKEILLEIKFEPKHFQEFINYCRDVFAENHDELKNITKLERNYYDETPIWWYTYNCFLYAMLNRSLRVMDVDIMIKMGFFISDLHRHIDKLHQEQFSMQNSDKNFTVYRGQGMSKSEFDRMSKIKGGLISFNNFLSTSKNQNISLSFVNSAMRNPDLVGILFVMTIDPSQSTAPFASIINVSYFKEREDEVLFAMHTIFRINDIKSMDEEQRFFQVDLTLTNDNDKDLRLLTDRIRGETKGLTGWDQLGELLLKISQPEKAEQVYNILLEQTNEEIDKARIYHQLGSAKDLLGEYREAVIYNEKALAIRKRLLPPNHPDLAKSYANTGGMYEEMNQFAKALSYHEKTHEIFKNTLPSNHPDLGSSYNNIGAVYHKMGEYLKALSYYEKSLAIRQQSLPPNHPHLSISYNNIGVVYKNIGEYSKALPYHEKSLEIKQQSLPPNHPDLGTSYNNMGLAYEMMGEYGKARSFFQRAVDIGQQSLSSNHPQLQKWQRQLDRVKTKL